MSGTIHLIVEDRRDAEVIRAILKARNLDVKIRPLPPKQGSISRLAKELDKLIQIAIQDRQPGDCIAVLHDADEQTQPNREIYDHIKRICASYEKDVVLIIARDELESWLLADSRLANWLKISPQNWDEQRKPSDTLSSQMQSKHKLKYQGDGRARMLNQIAGDGDKLSPSFRKALKHLENAPCMKP